MDVVEANFAELGNASSVNNGSCLPAATHIRSDIVEAAYKFMINPKVSGSSLEEQERFLARKGLSEAEIAEARRRANEKLNPEETVLVDASCTASAPANPTGNPGGSGFMNFINATVSIGCISYVGYRFIRSYVLPKLFKIPDPAAEERRQLENQISDLQNSMKFVMDSAVQTLNKVHEQQECLRRAISIIEQNTNGTSKQLESDVSIIKSLLLNPAIKLDSTDKIIPSWQQAPLESKQNGYWETTTKEDGCCLETEDTD